MKTYDYDELYPGRFLKSGLFKGKEATLTIANILLEEMEDKKGVRARGIISFTETPKQLVLNRTNGECLKGMFGRDTGKWVGKRVTFYPATVEAFGAPTLAIRVRGSPDLPADMEIICKVGRSGDVRVTMKRTGQKPAAKANGKAAPALPAAPVPAAAKLQITDNSTPAAVTTFGEPPDDVALPGSSGLALDQFDESDVPQ